MLSKAKPCKYCNNPVAYNAKRCPKCGGKRPYPDILSQLIQKQAEAKLASEQSIGTAETEKAQARIAVRKKTTRFGNSHMIGCLGIAICILLLAALLPDTNSAEKPWVGTNKFRAPTSTSGIPNRVDAWYYACDIVRDRLSSPTSAKFPSVSDSDVRVDLIEVVEDPRGSAAKFYSFSVDGYVDSENSFGTNVRKRFYVELWTNGSKWLPVDDVVIR